MAGNEGKRTLKVLVLRATGGTELELLRQITK
jgi:hypothetical protein